MIHRPFRCLWIVAAVAILTECAQSPTQQQQPPVAQSSNQPLCQYIQGEQPFEKWKDCHLDTQNDPAIGNVGKFTVLDFSDVSESNIAEFFAKAVPQTKLVAGIRIVNHTTLQTLDMEKIMKWTGKVEDEDVSKIFIEIAHNPKLETIKVGTEKLDFTANVPILVYNNPSLTLGDKTVKLFKSKANDDAVIEQNRGVCQFQHPLNSGGYFKPTTDFLSKCEEINGDLDIEDVTLDHKVDFKSTNSCLRLVNVKNLGNLNLTPEKKGSAKCNHDVESMIMGNDQFCGDKLKTLAGFFPDDAQVTITPDNDSCATICKTADQVNSIYDRCLSIDGSADISAWFTDQNLMENLKKLENATGILTIANTNAVNLTLPNLKKAEGLIISNNKDLVDIDLGNLTSINTLKMNGNIKLHLYTLNNWNVTINDMGNSNIECQADTINNVVTKITDVKQFWHCQKFVDTLTLSRLQADIQPGELPLKEMACLYIADTQLTNLDFLKNVTINCTSQHVFERNPELCVPAFLGRNVRNIGSKEIGCGDVCKTLTKGNKCITLQADLTITDDMTDDLFNGLEILEGQFVMKNTKHVTLKLANLTKIVAKKAPAIVVKDNSKLKSLFISLTQITVADGKLPLVEISGNPELSVVASFLPTDVAQSCSKKTTGQCYHAEHGDKKKDEGPNWAVIIGSVIGSVVFIGALSIIAWRVIVWRRKKKLKDANKEEDEKDKKARLTRTPKGGRKRPKQKSKTETSSDPKTTSAEKVKSADTSTSKTGAVSQTGETSKQTSPASGHKPPAGKKAAVVPAANLESGGNFVEKKISNIEGLKYFNAHLVLQELLNMVWTKRIDKTTPSGEKTGQWNDQKLTATGRLHILAVAETTC